MRKIPLETKILGLVLTLSLFLILLLTTTFSYMEGRQIAKDKGQLALELSKTISFMPTITAAFETEDPAGTIQPVIEKIRRETGAEFIVVGNEKGIRYSHPSSSEIGKRMKGGDNSRALRDGEYYVSEAAGSLGLSIRGKSPIFNKDGKIIGIVSVGFLVEDVRAQIFKDLSKEMLISLLAIIISIIGSYMLARSIRKDTLGLEPFEIANLYKEKNAVLQSVKEGILAIDQNGLITSMNQPAKKLLDIKESVRHLNVDGLFPSKYLLEVLRSGEPQVDKEISWKDKSIIVNCTPIFDSEGVSGVVASFRDRTELEEMVNTLSEVKMHSEDLRAQTHEFTNKLYVLSGLIQLGEYDEAIDMIQSETSELHSLNRVVFEQIKDTKVQALLLGKIGKASEKKISFEIDPQSYLEKLPDHIKLSQLTLIVGNLLDNALEAVSGLDEPLVKFFATDIGNDLVFEVSDNGKGIHENDISCIFERGFTSKNNASPSGYGLSNADQVVKELEGIIEVQSEDGNTIFTVYLPKQRKGGETC
ncbi:sensor histidine kinase [Peribacillus muralis]|uniref:ATP-binding protein n=1 Tax=Peribacillus muralis TaxID=264697 RepID=UPI001F4DA8A7|nr:sensor histidine kinase [Peribacillus muralis]MCK1992034.1 sensor histidine kinase [Peribacillus muralis]MCK2012590.1 sensor histidine kinase [Peribacillus muralis]